MDLDDFDAAVEQLPLDPGSSNAQSPKDAVRLIDAQWYTPVSRRGRWMDLIGDYAGSEPFVVDGEALLQLVLDDPLLALGRTDDVSFQIVHAIYTMERVLHEISSRSASFEIVFWHDRRFLTLQIGEDEHTSSSRTLARSILFNHLSALDIPVHTFLDTSDPAWLAYRMHTKPMFVMTNDGGVVEGAASTAHTERILLQRVFIYTLLAQGISITLLKGAEYRDSKILSFVYEQRVDGDPKSRFQHGFWLAVQNALQSLTAQETDLRAGDTATPLEDVELLPARELAVDLVNNLSESSVSQHELFPELLQLFVAHILFVPHLGLKERAQPPVVLPAALSDHLHTAFLPRAFLDLEDAASAVTVDGRVFAALLDYVLRAEQPSLSSMLGPEISTAVEEIWSECNIRAPDFVALRARFPPAPVAPAQDEPEDRPLRLLPFEHLLFDEELASIALDVEVDSGDEDEDPSHLEFNTVFSDTQHWHNHKRAILPPHMGGSDTHVQLTEWQRKRQLKSEQRFMAKLQWQAETLTGAYGTPLQQMVIPSAAVARKSKGAPASSAKADAAASKPSKGGAGKKGKKEVISSADKIRQANQAKKQTKEDDSNVQWWKDQLKDIEEKSVPARIVAIENLMRNKRTKEGWLAVEARLYRLHLEFLRWLADPAQDSAAARDRYSVTAMCMSKEIFESKELFPTAVRKLATCLAALGLEEYIDAWADAATVVKEDRLLNFDFVKLVKSKSGHVLHKWMRITEDPVVWQLRLFGEYMDRSMDSQSDPRVAFKPDAWQRKVLDCLDQNESVLVAAPTSAGKTFISYYAMETLLRSSDDDILVYVAPTKALVGQIAAEVYARFRKELGTKACWAIHTRDYRVHNPQNCQILVTAPEVLATMLLSPPMAKTWTPRIKRIILDEIHTIGQQEGGAVWEQIILLAPCPLIGLSATIGEPEKFNAWLASVQEAHGFKHTFIRHPHRYSHLRKYTYLLQPKDKPAPFNGLAEYRKTERLRFIHPISMLSFGARSLPSDFSLEAADCLSLFYALGDFRDRLSFDLDALDPTRFFPDSKGTLLKQKEILRYEAALTKEISEMMESNDPQDQDSVLNGVIRKVSDPMVETADQRYIPAAQEFYTNLITLVSDLQASGDLPALLFNFDRKVCENMAQAIIDVLEKTEERWRETNPEWKRKIKQFELWESKAKERERQADRLKKAKKDDEPAADRDTSWEASFDPDDPSPQFSFAGSSQAFSKADLDDEIRSLGWTSTPDWALKALRRGVGVHHSGMNKHYRTLVESLYRSGFLRVVIATGTLALGINAPTKTSVFCGDSPFLTALMYRQCAGRAGRRGYDLLGKVVFYGLAMDRCQRLVLSKLPSLGGNFPLTSTMVLRLFNLLQGSNDAPVARDAIRSILRLPHITFVSDVGREQLLHHIRFSIDYLRRAGLLDAQGNPINLYGVAAHLYYTEPSNLALIALLRHGVVHKICSHANPVRAKRDLLLLLCHLFGRRYLPKAYASATNLKAITQKSPSVVVLPPLPGDARKVLLEHEQHIKRVFTGYALAYLSQHQDALGEDTKLPFSGKTVCEPEKEESSPFRERLQRTAVSTLARSPFVATSGHGDSFGSVSELASTARQGLHVSEHAIPSMRQFTAIPGADNDEFALNAYLLDFYTHGQTAALKTANGIRDGEVWYVLQDFTLTLKTIRTGLVQLLQKAGANASRAESVAGDGVSEIDSGYGTIDPAEADDVDSVDGAESYKRPVGVTDRDWRVFEVLNAVTAEFDEKFRAMWA
ncbi:P-loop containing nucleoside triphosphate hydrolase protein [Trametes versicolor FP-101664 SS1]|uniref:P-loop containing nucleoside triphosphate hydrolase protein n=1 Tax=Trametes versicolor (strain FP-101664) TaxID=717944 RepID=UPI0004622945|nr:P-loop containing nucleoside triphosphate hydrolase protein [Trametes versicolor FP-101664 SS1]EIW61285.1 P-loop containing nucleoside triphosphate hydrolase protein [Trametes versicolor FP-101664 SS1]